MNKFSLFTIISLMLFFACRKDDDNLTVTVDEEPPVVLVRNTLRGRVLTEDGFPLANAEVRVRTENAVTDHEGRFIMRKIAASKDGGLVQVKHPDYFSGSKFVNFSADGSSFSEITMMRKEMPQIFDSNEEANIRINGGTTIKIAPNSITTKSGESYSGNVEITARYLDPTAENLGAIMPGELTGKDENGNEFVLATYGMTIFELQSDSGIELELMAGTTAEIEMPIPAELENSAPADIPLWFFDFDEEKWVLAGNCKKSSGSYICHVPSTGMWNCDVALESICLSGQVFNADTTFSSFLRVEIEDLTDNFIYWGWTDSLGTFCGSVPKGALLRLTLKDHCDNVIFTEDIGPFADDFMLPIVYLDDIVNEYILNVKGQISHCVSNDVPNGHVGIRIPGKLKVFPFVFGGFDLPLALKCTDFPEMEVTVYSNSQPYSTTPAIHSDSSDLDIGQVYTCDSLVDYFSLKISDTLFYQTSPTQFYFKNNSTTDHLIMEALTPEREVKIELRDYSGVGTYDVNAFFSTTNISHWSFPILESASPDISVEITDDNGDYISGRITGTATDLINQVYTIDGNFVIRRAP